MRLKTGRNGGNRNILAAFAAVAILCLSSIAGADIISLPLNCAGTYDVNTPAWNYNFDLGVTFSEISHVYIDWSGEIYGRLLGVYGHPDTIPTNVSLYAEFSYPPIRVAKIFYGASTYPNPETFNIISEFLPAGTNQWNDLLDGIETISIYNPKTLLYPEYYIIDYGRIVLNNATLIVEGTVIPEPSTLLILSIGILGIWTRKVKNQ